jgi:hypothetical protein
MTTKSKTISIIAIIAISAILMTAVIISQDAFAKCKKYRGHGSSSSNGQSQAIAQANVCGNGNLATNIDCQNLASHIQGDGNAVNVIGLH